MSKTCSLCDKPQRRRGLCWAHYERWRKWGDPAGGRTPNGEPLRYFHEVVLVYSGGACLLWPYGVNDSGYGQLRVNGEKIRAHRLACELRHGPPANNKLDAAHRCGTPGCVNPDHIYWATRSENMADCVQHGTRSRGERHGLSKLSEDAVFAIRRSGRKQHELAKIYGVSQPLISRIRNRRDWGWLDDAPA